MDDEKKLARWRFKEQFHCDMLAREHELEHPEAWKFYRENQELKRLIIMLLDMNILDSLSGKTKSYVKIEEQLAKIIGINLPENRPIRIITSNDW
jgi:hypothetical protein